MENFDKENKYIRAKQRVVEIKKFYTNLISYIIFITFLAILNYVTNSWRQPWFLWAAFGWGLGILFHAAKAFQWNPVFNKDWEERKIKEFMDKENDGLTKTQHWE